MIQKRLIQKSYKLLRDTKPRGWSRRAETIEGYDADEFHQRYLVPKKKAHRQSICSILKKRATDMGKNIPSPPNVKRSPAETAEVT